ncbi:MAG TPA: 2-dehydropantoate 2-reductase [Stellaceae bacterium]|nr:2-dehydropantoate 2-reductase [Stellaceae bacterium]
MMGKPRICVFGAGAIGGLLGAKLAAAGVPVTLIARGAHLEAIRAEGLRLALAEGEVVVKPAATDDPARLGPQDIVIFAVKTPALRAAAVAAQPLIAPGTVIVAAANGVPWWYFHGHAAPHEGHRLASVDPDGRLWEKLPPARSLGCVVYAAGQLVAPGTVRHLSGRTFVLGDPGGALGDAAAQLAALLREAGFEARVSPDIRQEVWNKLWGNLAFNPLSLLTGAPLDRLARDADSRGGARHMMVEARAVGERLGIRFSRNVDDRIKDAEAVGAHKTSMLQDFERGRPVELDALLGAVLEMGRLVEVETPICELVYGLARQRARLAGCYPER